ncbi:hypothetical protein NF867_03870 [Solitalea sp. MAHUQ-68]|uniref:Uncharacterized protein n=1 Tax=Solitalea agri TaxID=2953739 RepID=A0A9X2JBH0_9SPHI|nr:hypothetical protein [Solitalea agri]MCO4291998.1 hypothetical protein [Solitalea agri]
MKASSSTFSVDLKISKSGKSSTKYAQQTYDYLKYLLGRKHQKYGPSAAMVYDDNCTYFCNND